MNQNRSKRTKKLLTLEDLELFYSNKYKRSSHFSAKDSGYQLAVQVPAVFEEEKEIEDDTLLYCRARFFHIGLNRNNSNVTKDAATKAMKTMAYKPVLANFCEIEQDGEMTKDFTSHDMFLDEEGNIQYLEHQIGCITAAEPWFEEYEDKEYVCGYVAIPRDYTEAVDIIERKNGTKVSVELLINECQYHPKTKELELTDVIVSGLTCLGTNPNTGKQVEEGMVNSRLDIKDFSVSRNSLFSSTNEEEKSKLIDTLDKLNDTLSNFNNENHRKEEQVEMQTEEFDKDAVEETVENESTETVVVTEEAEVDTEVEEVAETETSEVVETQEAGETEGEVPEEEENEDDEEPNTTDEEDEEEVVEEVECKKYQKVFELSQDDIRCGLYNLLALVEEQDETWYYIEEVFDDRFYYSGWSETEKHYCQYYTKDNETDVVAFDGDRIEVFIEKLTAEEKANLEDMRSNYSSISEKLEIYEKQEKINERRKVLNQECYQDYIETEEFKKLMSDETLLKYSVEQLVEKADSIIGKFARTQSITVKNFAFAAPESVGTEDFFGKLLAK